MSLTKDEVVKMAHEADDTIRSKPFTAEMLSFLERFATLCRAPLVAEVERLEAEAEAGVFVHGRDMDWLRAERDTLKAELARVRAGKPVLWQYRWTNPSGDPYQESQMDWKQVKPTWNQTVQQNCDELLAYRFEGKPIYEVRALYATPPRPAAQEPVGVFVSDAEFGRIDLVPHHGAPMVDGQAVYATPPSAVPVVRKMVEALEDAQRAFSPAVHVGVSSAIAAGQQYLKENGK